MIRIKVQNKLIERIRQGEQEGYFTGDYIGAKPEHWSYSKVESGKHLLWIGRNIADISSRMEIK